MRIPKTQPEDDRASVLDAPKQTHEPGRQFSFRPGRKPDAEQARGNRNEVDTGDMPYNAGANREPDMAASMRAGGQLNPTLSDGYDAAPLDTGYVDRTQYNFTREESRPIDMPEKTRPMDWEYDYPHDY